MRWGSALVKLGAIGGLTTTMLVMLLGQRRIFFSMARDGLLPEWAGKVHPRSARPTSQPSWRIVRGAAGRFAPHLDARRADEHRHALRLHHRVRRSLDSAPAAAPI